MRVFISYSTEDKPAAEQTLNVLQTNGFTCWMAPSSIGAGGNYARCIPPAIRNCDVFVLLLSKNAQLSKYVPIELDFAVKYDKFIIPFRIDESKLNDEFDFFLSRRQRIEAFLELDQAYDEMITSMRRFEETGEMPRTTEIPDQPVAPPDNPEQPDDDTLPTSLLARVVSGLYTSIPSHGRTLLSAPLNAEQFLMRVLPDDYLYLAPALAASKTDETAIIEFYEGLTELGGIPLRQFLNRIDRLASGGMGSNAQAMCEFGGQILQVSDLGYATKLTGRFLSYASGNVARGVEYLVLWSILGELSYLSLCHLIAQHPPVVR